MRTRACRVLAVVLLGAVPFRLPAAPAGAADPGLPPPAADLAARAKADPRVREYISPARVVWKTTDPKSPVENAEALLGADSGQVTLSNPVACTLRHKGQAPGIVLDFGRELSGGVQIQMSASHKSQPVRLRVRFGESVSEAMSEHVLGVTVLEPGCAAVRIAPQLGDLQWAEGTFPTPKGVIKLLHEKGADGKVVSKIDAPEGVRIER